MPRTTVEVPDAWAEAADEMDVSLAEYCRRMVRAGRRQLGCSNGEKPTDHTTTTARGRDQATTVVEQLVYSNLSTTTGRDTEELVAEIEADIGAAADTLVADGKAKYRRAEGGWIKTTDE